MKRSLLLIYFAIFLIVSSCGNQPAGIVHLNPKLDSLLGSYYETKDFFKFRDTLKKNAAALTYQERLFFFALVHGVFNQPEISNMFIDTLLKSPIKDNIFTIYELKTQNHAKLFQYKEAAATLQKLMTNYDSIIGPDEKKNFKSEMQIWEALTDVPSQKIVKLEETKLQLIDDVLGMLRVPVTIDTSKYEFIFDTGANLSTVTETYAKKIGLHVLDKTIDVSSSNSNVIKSKLGYADKIKLGNIEISNVVFIIMPDSALTFQKGTYKMNGILGFPVINQLGEIRFHFNKNEIMFPAFPTKSKLANLALDDLVPVVKVKYKNDILNFKFDTGARTTKLYLKFYDRYKDDIKDKIDKVELEAIGGKKNLTGIKVSNLTIEVGTKLTELKDVKLYLDVPNQNTINYYGKIGKDALKMSNEVIINMNRMFFLLN